MPTVRSSTRGRLLADELRAVADVRHLLRFRARTVRRRGPVHLGGRDPGHGHRRRGDRARLPARRRRQRPGDRVLRPDPDRRSRASWRSRSSRPSRPEVAASCCRATRPSPTRSARPPTTSAPCCMAPLNIAWLLQAWGLLGSAAYAFGPGSSPRPSPWSCCSGSPPAPRSPRGSRGRWSRYAVGPRASWSMRGLVRGGRPVRGSRLHLSGRLTGLLDRLPTVWFVSGGSSGLSWRFALTVVAEIAILVAAVVFGDAACPLGLAADAARRGASRERDAPAAAVTALGPARADPYRPFLGVA